MDTSVLSIQQAARGDGLSRFKRGLSRPLHHALRRCWCSSALWQTSQAWFGLVWLDWAWVSVVHFSPSPYTLLRWA